MSNQQLFYLSLNEEQEQTIVLLHGLLSCHLEWALVIPSLKGYHLLVPDLCGHSKSKDIQPVNIRSSAEHVALLIRDHAHGQRAHVVGLSMGGFVALTLAQHHPDLVHTVFVTGASPFQGINYFLASRPSLIWWTMRTLLHLLPDSIYWWAASAAGLHRHDELLQQMRENLQWETIRGVYSSILDFSWEDVQNLKTRTLAVAGGKQDDVSGTDQMGRLLQARAQEDDGSKAVVVRAATHAWNLQFPDLFAQGILAWVEKRALPVEFEDLG